MINSERRALCHSRCLLRNCNLVSVPAQGTPPGEAKDSSSKVVTPHMVQVWANSPQRNALERLLLSAAEHAWVRLQEANHIY